MLISWYFDNKEDYKIKLRDIIFTNFFYYSLIDSDNEELDLIRERCRYLLTIQVRRNIEERVWENVWNSVYFDIIQEPNNHIFL